MTTPGVPPYLLHFGMFQSGILKLGSDEQYKKYEEDVKTLRIIGCYAQTELGHGSNVAKLETTATFDQQTDEFIIHSPTVTSTKYWPGSLGVASNHALVFARTIVGDNDYGIMAFVV